MRGAIRSQGCTSPMYEIYYVLKQTANNAYPACMHTEYKVCMHTYRLAAELFENPVYAYDTSISFM